MDYAGVEQTNLRANIRTQENACGGMTQFCEGVFGLFFGFGFYHVKAKSQTKGFEPESSVFQKPGFFQCKIENIFGYTFNDFWMELCKYICKNF